MTDAPKKYFIRFSVEEDFDRISEFYDLNAHKNVLKREHDLMKQLTTDGAVVLVEDEKGQIVAAHPYSGEKLNWDLRASADNWQKWFAKEVGIVGIAAAYTTSKLKFASGDYAAMVKDPRMAAPFIKSFAVMARASR